MSDRAAGIVSTIDHLVVFAHSLQQGAQWCGDMFAAAPGPGGRHELMGTHNRLMKIGSPDWPQAYLEIIALDPTSEQAPAAGRARWFGIDDQRLRQLVASEPRLVHYVASSSDLSQACSRLTALGEDVGKPIAASRQTPDGELRWQITLRDDGVPQHRGALPALICWQGTHPSAAMPDRGVRLRALRLRSARPQNLARALRGIGLDGVDLSDDDEDPPLEAVFESPRGTVTLRGGQPSSAGTVGRTGGG